jgi:hypothetical protein
MAEKELAKAYLKAFKETEDKIAKLYAKAGPDMTLVEARVNGLTGILKNIDKEYKKLTGESVKFTVDVASKAYEKSYSTIGNAIPNVSFSALPKKTILESVLNKNSTYNLIKTFAKNLPVELEKINSAITSGIASGRGYVNTARLIQGSFERGFNDALRVVRTEEGRNWTEGALKAHDEAVKLDPALAENNLIFPSEEFLSLTNAFRALSPEEEQTFSTAWQRVLLGA